MRANAGDAATQQNTSACRVLLAEDDREMRRLVASRLRRAGLKVVEASDGSEVLQLLADQTESSAFDLLISDVRMPGCSGLQLLAALRTAGVTLPVILITAFGSAETHSTAAGLGACAVFDKPFDIDELLDAVRAVAA